VATSLDIPDADFMAGKLNFKIPGKPNAVVANEGQITAAQGGLAALVAPGVENAGVITARLGTVALAAGNTAVMDFYGDGLVQIAVSEPTQAVPVDGAGKPVKALVSQTGQIYADGGTVVLTAEAAAGVLTDAVNMEGVIQARTIANKQGQIALLAGGETGKVEVSGTLEASGKEAGQTGGTVHVLGGTVAVKQTAKLDVSGDAGGGTVLIGGDYQGKALQRTSGLAYVAGGSSKPGTGAASQGAAKRSGTVIVLDKALETAGYIPTSEISYVEAGAEVAADGTGAGDGGKVIVWADQATQFAGSISAQGGATAGDGGFVEVSGKKLGFTGNVTTAAANGAVGTLLLDPTTIIVSAADGDDAQLDDNQILAGDPPATMTISPTKIVTQLGANNVLLRPVR
jgi:hypothetical protein